MENLSFEVYNATGSFAGMAGKLLIFDPRSGSLKFYRLIAFGLYLNKK